MILLLVACSRPVPFVVAWVGVPVPAVQDTGATMPQDTGSSASQDTGATPGDSSTVDSPGRDSVPVVDSTPVVVDTGESPTDTAVVDTGIVDTGTYDPCATWYGYTYVEVPSYAMAAGSVNMGAVGTGWVCSATCDQWWLTVDIRSDDGGAVVLALPALVAPDTARVFLAAVMPDADGGVGVCTVVTSAGDLTYTLTVY